MPVLHDLPATAVLSTGAPDLTVRGTTARLRPRGPFSLDAAHRSFRRWAPLRRHVDADADDASGVIRFATLLDGDHTPVGLALRRALDGRGVPTGEIEIDVAGVTTPAAVRAAAAQAARTVSLDHDASGLADVARRDPAVGAVLAAAPGARPVLFASPYEAAVWAVVSPRIGMRGAATVVGRLAAEHGTRLEVAGGEVLAPPAPAVLRELTTVAGLPAEKVRRLHGVAEAALRGDLDVDRLRGLGPVGARAAVRDLHGIGPFWASGIWLRACGVVDEWPDEPTCAAVLARLHGRDPDGSGGIDDLVGALAPFRTWIAFALRMGA